MSNGGDKRFDLHAYGLLLWLSRQEWTPAEECHAEALERLRSWGLAHTMFRQSGVEAITLTAMGWAEVARIQEKLRPLGGAVLEQEEASSMLDDSRDPLLQAGLSWEVALNMFKSARTKPDKQRRKRELLLAEERLRRELNEARMRAGRH